MFVWGRQDMLVPIAFIKHVERALPAARHVELDCGHVPQIERPRPGARRDRELPAEGQAGPARERAPGEPPRDPCPHGLRR